MLSNQFLRFDVMATVNGSIGALVTNIVSVSPPAGTTALNTGNDSATDQDIIIPQGVFANGFEDGTRILTVPGASEAMNQQ